MAILKELAEMSEFEKAIKRITQSINETKYNISEGGNYSKSSRKNDAVLFEHLQKLEEAQLKNGNKQTDYILEQLRDLTEEGLTADAEDNKEIFKKLTILEKTIDVAAKTDDDRKQLQELLETTKKSVKSNANLFKRGYEAVAESLPEKFEEFGHEIFGNRFAGKALGLLGHGIKRLLPSFDRSKEQSYHLKNLLAIAERSKEDQESASGGITGIHKVSKEIESNTGELAGVLGSSNGKIEKLEVDHLLVNQLKSDQTINKTEKAVAEPATSIPQSKTMISPIVGDYIEKQEAVAETKTQTGVLKKILATGHNQFDFFKKNKGGLFSGAAATVVSAATSGVGDVVKEVAEAYGINKLVSYLGKSVVGKGVGNFLGKIGTGIKLGKNFIGKSLGRGIMSTLALGAIDYGADAITPDSMKQKDPTGKKLSSGVSDALGWASTLGMLSLPETIAAKIGWKGGTAIGTGLYNHMAGNKYFDAAADISGSKFDQFLGMFSKDARDRLDSTACRIAAKQLGQAKLNPEQEKVIDGLTQNGVDWNTIDEDSWKKVIQLLRKLQRPEDVNAKLEKAQLKKLGIEQDQKQMIYQSTGNAAMDQASVAVAKILGQKNLSVAQARAVQEAMTQGGVSDVNALADAARKAGPAPELARREAAQRIDAQVDSEQRGRNLEIATEKIQANGPLGTGVQNAIEVLTQGETKKGMAGYNQIYGGAAKFGTPEQMFGKPLTELTVDQIQKWQHANLQNQVAAGVPYNQRSSAVGKGQFISGTFKEVAKELGLKGDEVFTPELQNRFIMQKLKDLGYDKWRSGKMSDAEFAKNVSGTWASVTDLSGRGQDDGIGLNRANVSGKMVLDALASANQKDSISNAMIAAQDNIDQNKTATDMVDNSPKVAVVGSGTSGGTKTAALPFNEPHTAGNPNNDNNSIWNHYTPFFST